MGSFRNDFCELVTQETDQRVGAWIQDHDDRHRETFFCYHGKGQPAYAGMYTEEAYRGVKNNLPYVFTEEGVQVPRGKEKPNAIFLTYEQLHALLDRYEAEQEELPASSMAPELN